MNVVNDLLSQCMNHTCPLEASGERGNNALSPRISFRESARSVHETSKSDGRGSRLFHLFRLKRAVLFKMEKTNVFANQA